MCMVLLLNFIMKTVATSISVQWLDFNIDFILVGPFPSERYALAVRSRV